MKKVLLGGISLMLFIALAYLPCSAAKVHKAILSLSSSQTAVRDTIPVQSKHPAQNQSDRQDNQQMDTASTHFPIPNTNWKTKDDTTIKDTMKDKDWNMDNPSDSTGLNKGQMQIQPSMSPLDTAQQK